MSRSLHPAFKLLFPALTALTMTALSLPAQAADKKQVNFYSYADYVDAQSIKDFSKATGIKFVYDTYADIGSAEAKLVSGATGYDVVNADIITMQRLTKTGLLQKLDKSKLPNWKNLDPAILKQMAKIDPNNDYMVPYFHGTDGIAYNVKRLQSIMKDAPVDSWGLLFNPDVVKQFKSCGVNLLDSNSDVVAQALNYIGKDPNPKTKADVDAAMAVLWKVRPYITNFDSSTYMDSLANGDYCLSMVWSGDHLNAQRRADDGKTGIQLAFFLPKEGTTAWFDGFFIPKTSKNVNEAYAFLNALMEPKFAAANINKNFYPGANLAAKPMISPKIVGDKNVYISDEAFAKVIPIFNTPGQDIDEYMTKSWNKLKSGKK